MCRQQAERAELDQEGMIAVLLTGCVGAVGGWIGEKGDGVKRACSQWKSAFGDPNMQIA